MVKVPARVMEFTRKQDIFQKFAPESDLCVDSIDQQ